ncbi:hypothetical protein [Bacillus swezeyi]
MFFLEMTEEGLTEKWKNNMPFVKVEMNRQRFKQVDNRLFRIELHF